jgi:PEP-CTERM motif
MERQMKHPKMYALALSGLLLAGGAHAGQPIASNTLGSGTTAGSVAAESYSFLGTADNWSFWTFAAPWQSQVTIQVSPDESAFDVVAAVWYGTEANTANFYDMVSGSLNAVLVASADLHGNGVAESMKFTNDYGSGRFTLAVADFQDGLGDGPLGYTITAQVPEPGTWALMLSGFALLAGLARSRA